MADTSATQDSGDFTAEVLAGGDCVRTELAYRQALCRLQSCPEVRRVRPFAFSRGSMPDQPTGIRLAPHSPRSHHRSREVSMPDRSIGLQTEPPHASRRAVTALKLLGSGDGNGGYEERV